MCIRDSHQTLQNTGIGVMRVGFDEAPQATHDFLHGLMKLGLMGVAGFYVGHEFRQVFVPVSYTHLDVYKRQGGTFPDWGSVSPFFWRTYEGANLPITGNDP